MSEPVFRAFGGQRGILGRWKHESEVIDNEKLLKSLFLMPKRIQGGFLKKWSRTTWIKCCMFFVLIPMAFAAEVRFETLRAGETVYRDVRVREVSANSILIIHSKGVAQVSLRQLSPELQARFNYDPQRAREFEEKLEKERKAAREKQAAAPSRIEPFVRVGREPQFEVDLRHRYFELGLHTKNQGRRPSCVVFALLGVLDFHYSDQNNAEVTLSEEFLIWATRQINPRQEDFDGFLFIEVLAAIRRYGLARSELMPNTLGVPVSQIVANQAALEDALTRRDVLINLAFGSTEAKIEAIVRELNEGYPVAVALAWPPDGVVARVHTLRDQPVRAGVGHAVTIVGYHRPQGPTGETLFLFRNSYGVHWGMGGYGYVSDGYLKEHLRDVVTFRLRET